MRMIVSSGWQPRSQIRHHQMDAGLNAAWLTYHSYLLDAGAQKAMMHAPALADIPNP
jgi:hypothetical protein